jgi:cytochrome P450
MNQTKTPPGPRGHFFIGIMAQYMKDPLGFFERCAREYGDVVRFPLPGSINYMVNHPADIESILRSNASNFRKDRFTRLMPDIFGQGLLTTEGEVWRRHRRLAQPAFQLSRLQQYADVMAGYAERLQSSWRDGDTRDIHADMMRVTLEIVAKTLFDADVTGDAAGVGEALEVIMDFFLKPINWFRFLQRLPTPGALRYRRAVRLLDRVIYDIIDRRRQDGAGPDDLLSRLLAARDDDGSGMTDRELRDDVMTLFLAGHETTALALSFCWYLLALHPEVEARLAAEVTQVLGDRPATAADVARLPYADAVVREAMRLYPPVPGIGREALVDCEIGGYPVRRGTQLWLVQWVVHRDGRWFAEPEQFKPERWTPDFIRALPRGAYFPFGDGPRICIGNTFAMMEAVLILATLVRRWRLELAPGYRLTLAPSITLRPAKGMPMILHRRSEPAGVQPPVSAAAVPVA